MIWNTIYQLNSILKFNTLFLQQNILLHNICFLISANLIPGGNDSLVYTTLSGTVGMLVPFTSHEDHDFFQHLEMHMRAENPPICGRDHLSYRSYYYPVKHVIDGDLCEQYNMLDASKQEYCWGTW